MSRADDRSKPPPGVGHAFDRLRLRHLQLVDTLARTGTVGQAAVELHVTQSAATKILQDVEQLFGAPLFERLARGMVPTPAGEQVVRYARRMLNETQRAVQEVGLLVVGGAGLLTLGAIMASMPGILPRAIAELRQRRPRLTIQLTATTSDEIITLLEQRKVEIGVCRLPDPSQHSNLDFEVLFDEEYWIFVAGDHPLVHARDIGLANLVDLPWVLQPRSSPSRKVLEAAFVGAGVTTPPSRVETTSRFATLNLVQHGGMIGMLPSTILADPIAKGDLARLPVETLRAVTGYGLVTRRGEPLTEQAAEFTSLIRRLSGKTAGLGEGLPPVAAP